MEACVRDFASENPDADYERITARFGSPKQIAESYLEEMEGKDLARHLGVKRKIVQIVAVMALVMVLLWAGVVFSAKAELDANMNGHFEYEVIVVERTSIEGEE